LHQHPGTAPDVGRDRRALDAERRDRSQAEDQDRVERDVERIGDLSLTATIEPPMIGI